MSTKHERITVDDVQVGDQVARTRSALFCRVETIDERQVTRRLHFAPQPCPVVAMHEDSTHCPYCHRTPAQIVAMGGHGKVGGGNIRPRRTAKLWRVVA